MMRALFLATLSLAACSGVNSGKSLEHPALALAVLGRGFDSLSSRPRGPCVATGPTTTDPSGVVSLDERVFYARSKQEVLREVGFSGGFSLGSFGIGAQAGFESLNRQSQSASTTFAVIQIRMESGHETLNNYRLERAAVEKLRREGALAFYEMCGDGFVAATRQGGYFLGIVALRGVSDADTRRLSGDAGLTFLGFGVRGEAHTELQNFLEKHQARYYIIQHGGDTGGPGTVQNLHSIDDLLRRGERFKQSVSSGKTVTTELIVEPYQITTNRPRRAELWDLTEQRRFLADLAVRHGELEKAVAELNEQMAAHPCTRVRDTNRREKLRSEYVTTLAEVKKRAEDCINNPRRRCKDSGLEFVDLDDQRKTLALCQNNTVVRNDEMLGRVGTSIAPSPKPGIDAPCRTWRFTSARVNVSPSKPGGGPWDADGSPPETAFTLVLGARRINFPTRSSYSTGGTIEDGLVSAGATVQAFLTDRDATFDDRIAEISDTAPEKLSDGLWTLESGRTSVSLRGRCVE